MTITAKDRELLKTFGEYIRKMRKERGWTLEETEEHGWKNWQHLQSIEMGKKNISLTTLFKLSSLFNIQPAELFRNNFLTLNEISNQTILIYERDEKLSGQLFKILNNHGYSAMQAFSQFDAVEILKSRKIDGVIANAQHSAVISFIDNMKLDRPALFLTTADKKLSLQSAHEIGANALIVTPIKTDPLLKTLAKYFNPKQFRFRRQFDRINKGFNVEISLDGFKTSKKVSTVNIGRGGMFISLNKDCPTANEPIEFRILSNNNPEQFIAGKGICKWIENRSSHPGMVGAGIEFASLSESSNFDLTNLIIEDGISDKLNAEIDNIQEKIKEIIRFSTLERIKDHSGLTEFDLVDYDAASKEKELLKDGISLILISNSMLQVSLKINFDQTDIKKLAYKAFDKEPEDVSELQSIDFIKEYCNLCAGHFQQILNQQNIPLQIGLPDYATGVYKISPLQKYDSTLFCDFWKLTFGSIDIICTIAVEIFDIDQINSITKIAHNDMVSADSDDIDFL